MSMQKAEEEEYERFLYNAPEDVRGYWMDLKNLVTERLVLIEGASCITTRYSAWVSVNGTPLTEYEAKAEDSKISCWIPSEVGQRFTVHFDTHGSGVAVCGELDLDGQFVTSRVAYPLRITTVELPGFTSSPTTQKPFIFLKLETTDDDTLLDKNADLGEIKLVIREVIVERSISFEEGKRDSEDYSGGQVHERAKKAIAHRAGLGKEITSGLNTFVQTRTIRTIVTFVFRYRPIGVLRANDIAPPLVTSGKRPADDIIDISELTDSEDEGDHDEERIAALQVQLATLQNKQRRRKKIKLDPDMKAEAEDRPRLAGEVIDLT
ncbi:hypothetical protein D9758_010206 [Tetrapyrgos nigripes]|uniref:DUF7918 domain-containing protein n=1 Tax=Tetrapyrgos nigripes TaxID=182062 RepID=A0A8H5CZ85_9AGAR|nr:hypothetical protein D9758_010206 [Tetrapyrgos nigripes]